MRSRASYLALDPLDSADTLDPSPPHQQVPFHFYIMIFCLFFVIINIINSTIKKNFILFLLSLGNLSVPLFIPHGVDEPPQPLPVQEILVSLGECCRLYEMTNIAVKNNVHNGALRGYSQSEKIERVSL